MKETYISPELELLCLAPNEALASGFLGNLTDVDYGDLQQGLGLGTGGDKPVSGFDPEYDVEIPLIPLP